MEINFQKKLVLGIIIIVAFMYFIFTISTILTTPAPVDGTMVCGLEQPCPHEQQLNILYTVIPLLVSLAVAVGAGTYYLMVGKIESKEKSLKKNADILLRFLNPNERKLVNLLIENKGKVLQAEITRLPEMSKLRSHRVVQKLIERGVIEKESIGKTNIVRFTKEVSEGLL